MAFTNIFKVNSSRKKKKAVTVKDYVYIGDNGSYTQFLKERESTNSKNRKNQHYLTETTIKKNKKRK